MANAGAPAGTTPTTIPINYAPAGGDTTVGVGMRVTWTNASLTATVSPAGNCAVNNMTRVITIAVSDAGNQPLPPTLLCTATYTIAAMTAPATVALTADIMSAGQGCFDATATATVCTATSGSIDIQAVSAPTLNFVPAADVDGVSDPGTVEIQFGAGGTGTTTTTNVAVSQAGGTAGQTNSLGNCSVTGAGLALGAFTQPVVFSTGGSTTTNIPVSCTYSGAGAQTGTLQCTQTRSVGGNVNSLWDINCPQGGSTPPTISYAPAPGSTVSLSGTLGSNQTSNIVVTRTSNGQAGASVTLQNPSALMAPFNAATGFPLTFPGGSGTPASGNIGISCTIPAATSTQMFTFDEVTSTGVGPATTTTRTYTVTCLQPSPEVTPAPAPGAIGVQGAPGTTQGTGISFQNVGLADLTLTCALGPVTAPSGGNITIATPPAATVVPGGTTSISIAVLLPNTQGQNVSATLTCTTNDTTGGEGTLTYTITGQAINIIVPTLSDWGKALMALMVLGLGLLGFTMHRRRAVS